MKSVALLTEGEELDLARRVRGDDPADALAARDELVLANLGLVGKAARYYRRRPGGDYDELFSEGVVCLIRAAERYDDAHGRFASFASPSIWHGIRDHLLESALVRVPNYLQSPGSSRPADHLTGREKATRERNVRHGQDALAPVRRLGSEHDMPGDDPPPLDAVIAHDTGAAVVAALGLMSPQLAYVLAHRRGLCGLPARSCVQLGRELGLSRFSVHRIDARALDEFTTALARTRGGTS